MTIMSQNQLLKMEISVWNAPIETTDVTTLLPKQADSNRLILVKLKRKLKHRDHVYIVPFCGFERDTVSRRE